LTAVHRGALCITAVAVLLLAACGGSSGSGSTTQQQHRLSAAVYRAKLTKIKAEAARAQAQAGLGLRAKTVPELKRRVDAYATATQHVGDELAALNPPQNAEAANAQLAKGFHDLATATREASAKIAKLNTVRAAIAYLDHSLGPAQGAQEVEHAVAKLKKLGYTSGS
jgi:hypothetical protein